MQHNPCPVFCRAKSLASVVVALMLCLFNPLLSAVRAQEVGVEPLDEKLGRAYRQLKFERMYPSDAVALIQQYLERRERAVVGLAELSQHERRDVRVLVATLLGELGETEGADVLWEMSLDQDEFVQMAAHGGLIRLHAMTPVTAITKGLRDDRWKVRRLTAATLGQLHDKSAEGALIETLDDEHELVRADVVKVLSPNTCGTEIALPSLLEMLKDPHVNVRDRAAFVLGHHKNPITIDPLVEALEDEDWHVRAAAAFALRGWVQTHPDVIPPLIEVLNKDTYALVRDRAAGSLGYAHDDEVAIDALVRAVISDDRDARLHASEALVTHECVSAVPKLLDHLDHPDPEVRTKIVYIVSELGSENEIPSILAKLEDADVDVRLTAVKGLRTLQEQSADRLDFEARLSDPNPHVRAASARTLGDLGRHESVPKLIAALRDEHSYVRGASAEALGKLGDRSAVQPLIAVLSGEEFIVEGSAIEGLIIGADEDKLPEVGDIKEVQQKIEVVRALGHLKAPEAIPPIVEHGLHSSDAPLRSESAVALGRIDDLRAVQPLEDVVRPYYEATVDPTKIEEGSIIQANTVADELRQMREKEARVRASVAWALGELADSSSMTILAKAANDENSLVRDAAREALAKISEQEDRRAAAEGAP